MKNTIRRLLIALALAAGASQAVAQGTAFTYQGQLNNGAGPANGSYDLTLKLFTAVTGGSQVGSTLTNTAVGVTNGLFTTTADFGSMMFDGTPLWLQIGVRTNGGGTGFTALSPRHQLTPTPYALYAPNAGVAASALTANGLATGSISGASIQPGTITAANLNLDNVSTALDSSFWSLTGNAGTGGTALLGTTDNQPLALVANGVRGLQLQYAQARSGFGLGSQSGVNVIGGYPGNFIANGVVGGTVAGGGDYYYNGILGGPVISYSNSVTGSFGTVGGGFGNTAGLEGTVPGGQQNTASGTASFAAGANAAATNNYSFVWSDGTALFSSGAYCFDIHAGGGIHVNNSDLFLDGGNDRNAGLSYRASTLIPVGTVQGIQGPFLYGFNGGVLGTMGPEAYSLQWDWQGNVWVSNNVTVGNNLVTAGLTVDNTGLNPGNVNSNALVFGATPGYTGEGIASKRSGAGAYDLEFYTDFEKRMTIDHAGNVNVAGTVIAGNVTVSGSLNLPANATLSSGGNGLLAGLTVDPASKNIGNINSNALVFGGGYGDTGEGIASARSGANADDLEFYTDFYNRMTIAHGGSVGIGTTTPTAALLEVNGDVRIDNNRLLLTPGTDTGNGLVYANGGLPFVYGAAGPFLFGYNGGSLGTVGPTEINLSWDSSGNVWVRENLSTATLTIRGGSDVAEPFPVTGSQADPGTVMVIDEANPGQLIRSTQAYDTRVAGIISGAGGINPGLELQQEGVLDQGQKVALSGRVYVQADATMGSIKPGDLLTTSDRPGCAMKVSDHARAQGAILGKAMTGLRDGKGLVLVLVTLQ